MCPEFHRQLVTAGKEAEQLLFAHRWLLLCFKREFPVSGALHVWESCWANYRSNYFHLFVCASIIATYGRDVIEQRLPSDEVLLYFSSLAMHMDADAVLKKVPSQCRPLLKYVRYSAFVLCMYSMID